MLSPAPPLANMARCMRVTTACLARAGMPVAHLATGFTRLAKRAVNDIAWWRWCVDAPGRARDVVGERKKGLRARGVIHGV